MLAVACCTVGATVGGALALADHQAAQQQAALAPLLADAAVVVQNVDSAGPRLEPPQLIGLLGQLQTANTAVERVATGRSWLIASSITRRGSLARTSDQAQGLALLADAAGPLRESLTALQNPDAGDPEHLNALARDLNRFASVSLRAQQLGTYPAPTGAAGTPFEVLATAAAVLPTMAGSEAPRFWTVCATADAGCWRFTVQDGRTVGRGTKVTGAGSETVDSETAGSDASDSDAADIVVRGRAPRDLLQNGRLSVTAILNTLVAMDSTDAGADDSAPVVTSSVPVEQHALGVIAKHGAR